MLMLDFGVGLLGGCQRLSLIYCLRYHGWSEDGCSMFLRSSQSVTTQKTTIDINSTPFFVKHHGVWRNENTRTGREKRPCTPITTRVKEFAVHDQTGWMKEWCKVTQSLDTHTHTSHASCRACVYSLYKTMHSYPSVRRDMSSSRFGSSSPEEKPATPMDRRLVRRGMF
jgi:hypothetical protein